MAKTKTTKKRAGAKMPRALSLLSKDHKVVSTLFKRYEKEDDQDEKRTILQMVCAALTAHAQLEEELFYPALRDALGQEGEDLLDEATVEHTTLKALVTELEDAEPGDELVDAKVTVLSEYVKHHVEEEENEIFPKAKRAKDLDLDELGANMQERKAQLEAEVGLGADDAEAEDDTPRRRGARTPVGSRG
jgi:hemerythrin superfamily protein